MQFEMFAARCQYQFITTSYWGIHNSKKHHYHYYYHHCYYNYYCCTPKSTKIHTILLDQFVAF